MSVNRKSILKRMRNRRKLQHRSESSVTDSTERPFLSASFFDLTKKTLVCAPWNYKLEPTPEQCRRFENSLKKGITPLHVAERAEEPGIWEVCDGNHRLEALKKKSELKKIPVYDHGTLSEVERKEIGLRYNGQWFDEDAISLYRCIESLSDEQMDLSIDLPYDPHEVENMLETLHALEKQNGGNTATLDRFSQTETDADEDGIDPYAEWKGMPEYEKRNLESKYRIIVHLETDEDLQRFAKAVNQKILPTTKYIWFPWQPRQNRTNTRYKNVEKNES